MRYLFLVTLIVSSVTGQANNDLIPSRIRVGNVVVTTRIPTLHSEVVLGTDHTIYAITLLGNGNKEVLPISKPGAAKALFGYRGWPYMLDRSGRIYTLNVSIAALHKSKRPAFFRRMLRHTPYAVAAGGAIVGVGELLSLFETSSLQASSTFWSEFFTGLGVYYVVDGVATFFVRSHGKVGRINLFTYPIASGIKDIKWREPGDYILEHKNPKPGELDLHISDLAPPFTAMTDCFYTLTAITEK